MLDRLVKMPDVDEVEEQPAGKHDFPGFSQKPIARLRLRPRKKFLVTLKRGSPTGQLESAGARAR